MLRIGLISLIILAGALYMAPGFFTDIKDSTVEVINPAAKERRLIHNLETEMSDLNSFINSDDFDNLPGSDRTRLLNANIDNISNIISEIEESNDSANLTSTLGNLVNKILPGSDKKEAEPTWLPPGQSCPECICP